RRRRMCRIGARGERRDADAPHGVNEALVFGAQRPIALDDALDCPGDLALPHRRPDDLAERGEAVGGAAEADLVPLLAVLVDAEDADVADVVVAAGVHAARYLD